MYPFKGGEHTRSIKTNQTKKIRAPAGIIHHGLPLSCSSAYHSLEWGAPGGDKRLREITKLVFLLQADVVVEQATPGVRDGARRAQHHSHSTQPCTRFCRWCRDFFPNERIS